MFDKDGNYCALRLEEVRIRLPWWLVGWLNLSCEPDVVIVASHVIWPRRLEIELPFRLSESSIFCKVRHP